MCRLIKINKMTGSRFLNKFIYCVGNLSHITVMQKGLKFKSVFLHVFLFESSVNKETARNLRTHTYNSIIVSFARDVMNYSAATLFFNVRLFLCLSRNICSLVTFQLLPAMKIQYSLAEKCRAAFDKRHLVIEHISGSK